MAGETVTPNVGFQIPAFNQPNWQVPINYNFNLLDLIFGGEFTVPALSVANFIIANIGQQVANSFVVEVPTGVIPGNAYNLSFVPTVLFGFYWNGVFQRPGIDYTLVGTLITMTTGATVAGDTVYAVYLK
jgi:hypothetical protein